MRLIFLSMLAIVLVGFTCAQARTSVSADDLIFKTPHKREFRDGESRLERQPVRWESDTAWSVTVESLDPDLGQSDQGGYFKPLSDLQYRLSTDRTWYELRRLPQEVATGAAGKGSFTLDWRVLLDIARDRPGHYRAKLRFTISVL